MRDLCPPPPMRCSDPVWALIPWYVNGSLPPAEADIVKRHSLRCPLCAAEIARQHRLAREVRTADPFDVPLGPSWQTLRALIDADACALGPRAGWQWWLGDIQWGAAAVGALAAACAVLLVDPRPIDQGFRTLTGLEESAATVVKFQLGSGVDPGRLAEILRAHDLTLVAGPSEVGVYVAQAPKDADLDAAAATLMRAPEILFATPDALR